MNTPEPMRLAMLGYCRTVIDSRPPDVVIGPKGNPYVHRWWLGPRGDLPSAYLHIFFRDDHDGALHDHRYRNVSVVLDNSYREHFHVLPLSIVGDRYLTESFVRSPGEVVEREASLPHRVELVDQTKPVTTIFYTGHAERDWGFHTVDGWMHWKEYNARMPERDNGNYAEKS